MYSGYKYNPDYLRKTDKKNIPVCNIMGTDLAAVDMDWLLRFTDEHYKELEGDYFCFADVHAVVTAYRRPEFRKVENGGMLVAPDGNPLVNEGHKRGAASMQRIPGPSFMERMMEISAEHGYKHYFYGSTPETLDKLRENLTRKYPGLNIVGMYSPPFRKLTEEEDREIIDKINRENADFIWIGLGCPKQETWMAEHQGQLNGLMLGVGAAFDYHAGVIHRAPEWMQKRSIEWLYRLIQNPKKLFFRYLSVIPSYMWNANIRKK